MDDNTTLWFGKHQGEKLANVPASYLLWLHEEYQKSPPVHPRFIELANYIEENLDVLTMEAKRAKRGLR